MTPPCESNHRSEIDRVIKDLLKGREAAAQLHSLLQGSTSSVSLPVAVGLMDEIRDTFSRVVPALDAANRDGRCLAAAADGVGSQCLVDRKSEVSAGGKRRACPRTDSRGGGGSRRRLRSSSSKTVMAKSLDDGQAWRKYGQKDIFNSKNPRSYFRCTRKYEQGCMAQRQAQRSEDDPSTYVITYLGEHTCRDPSTIPYAMEASSNGESCLISFEFSTTTDTHIGHEAPLSSSLHSLKQEGEEEVLSNQIPAGQSAAGAPAPETVRILELGPESGDVTSIFRCPSGHLNMGFLEDSFELEDLAFDFENSYFQLG